ncbi:hypothetical protein D8O27_19780 [Burkholderia mallei]|uniref:hypothetical protein n=1 Tax=Burkholderia mallei TaxID=13373 RepID=UPI000939D95F|nr:hypothetical protein [Burkholderia mallei]RKN95472.1 hypothetical protein D8O31_19850 [Burkholderia mallei]RKO10183.1 hypothetical protein D8O04_22525 [Burkholderia mallei]RKO19104.1 hypothetical protein D8O30_17605 [Burkholderia mallei]RKO27098.1 hypothetical protein D8O27_19780 [Burkholderia mallei]RKO39288.1 hypothetical protein D8O06_18450 [Burkholderia mallei]
MGKRESYQTRRPGRGGRADSARGCGFGFDFDFGMGMGFGMGFANAIASADVSMTISPHVGASRSLTI